MNNYWQHRNDINRLFNAPRHKRLKSISLSVIGIVIAAQFAMIIWNNDIPTPIKPLLQGCIGIGALIFVILVAILAYRVFTEYFRDRHSNHRTNR